MTVLDYEEIGQNIREYRMRKGLKQKDLAELINVTAQHISHIERNRTQASLPVLVDIANALNTDINTLLGTNLKAGRRAALDVQIAEELDGTSAEFRAHILDICRREKTFYKTLSDRPEQ